MTEPAELVVPWRLISDRLPRDPDVADEDPDEEPRAGPGCAVAGLSEPDQRQLRERQRELVLRALL